MTNILGKIAETLGLGGEDGKADAAGAGGAGEKGGATDKGLSASEPAAAGGHATAGTDPIRPGGAGGAGAGGALGMAGTEPITPASDPAGSRSDAGGARLRSDADDLADLPEKMGIGALDGGDGGQGENELRTSPGGGLGTQSDGVVQRSHDLGGDACKV